MIEKLRNSNVIELDGKCRLHVIKIFKGVICKNFSTINNNNIIINRMRRNNRCVLCVAEILYAEVSMLTS